MTKKTYRERRTKHPQFLVTLTREQLAALDAITVDQQRNDFVRDAIGAAVKAAGGEWPENMPEKGHALKSNSEENVNSA